MTESYEVSNNLEAEYKMTAEMLQEIKVNGVKLIAADYDGTTFDRDDQNLRWKDPLTTIKLAYDVTKAGIDYALISARNTTLEVIFRVLIPLFCQKIGGNLSIYRSGGNGMNLSIVTYTPNPAEIRVEPIYTNFVTPAEVTDLIGVFNTMYE